MGWEPGQVRVRGLLFVPLAVCILVVSVAPASALPSRGRHPNRPLFSVISPPVAASGAFGGASPQPVNSAVLALNPNDPFDLFVAGNDYDTACPTKQGFYRSLDADAT